MTSKPRTTKLPGDLSHIADLRALALGYPSWNAYICGLIRYDAMVQGPHTQTLPIAQARPEDRDKIDAELLELTKQGIGTRGSFLQVLLRKINSGLSAEEIGKEIVTVLSQVNHPEGSGS